MPFYQPRGSARLCALAIAGATLGMTTAVLTQPRLSQQDATRFQAKLAAITQYAQAPPRTAQPRSTQLTDAEVNSYLKFGAGSQIPVGIVEPTLNALGEGRVSGKALVDLDAVRKQKKRSWTDPMNYLSGLLPLTASGILTTQNGVGRFQLESAQISGVPIPKTFLQELLSYYSKTPENPAGIGMDDPFELPARIREIRVAPGVTTVVQ
jgi:hypothetical protein